MQALFNAVFDNKTGEFLLSLSVIKIVIKTLYFVIQQRISLRNRITSGFMKACERRDNIQTFSLLLRQNESSENRLAMRFSEFLFFKKIMFDHTFDHTFYKTNLKE